MVRIALILLFAIVVQGCATITRGTKDTLVIESVPGGASVTLSNGMVGATPTSFKLSRKENVIVRIEKEGYEPVAVNVNSQVDTGGGMGMAGNVIFGGLIGAGIDAGTGATNSLKPNPVSVTLVPVVPDEPLPREDDYSIPSRLQAILKLYEDGLISEEEYRKERERILADS